MNIGATHMLCMAERTDEGQLYNLISCIIFCAFTLEAYFNHLGAIKYDDWIKEERSLSKLKKYTKFCKDLNVSYDFNVRPYSTLTEVFRFRDTMAHGKTSVDEIEKEMEIELDKVNYFSAGAEWKEYATLANAKKALNDVHELIKELHQSENLGNDPFNTTGGGFFAISHT
jgi:hypothetical protein